MHRPALATTGAPRRRVRKGGVQCAARPPTEQGPRRACAALAGHDSEDRIASATRRLPCARARAALRGVPRGRPLSGACPLAALLAVAGRRGLHVRADAAARQPGSVPESPRAPRACRAPRDATAGGGGPESFATARFGRPTAAEEKNEWVRAHMGSSGDVKDFTYRRARRARAPFRAPALTRALRARSRSAPPGDKVVAVP
jgi:hypothetical protein